jgi:hypothetical protein
MMLKHQVNGRTAALVAGALIYTILQSGAVLPAFETWLAARVQASTVIVKIASSLVYAIGLVVIVPLIEIAFLWVRTRRIRGWWVYKETARSWGYARIFLDGVHLRYSVDLYASKAEVLKAIRKQANVRVAHGYDRMTVYADGQFYAWYYVPGVRDYGERQGILTLVPANVPDDYSGSWARLGPLRPAVEMSGNKRLAAVAQRDEQLSAGNFEFFLRKKAFLAQANTIED